MAERGARPGGGPTPLDRDPAAQVLRDLAAGRRATGRRWAAPTRSEVGRVLHASGGIAWIRGLPGAFPGERVAIDPPPGRADAPAWGRVEDLTEDAVAVVLLHGAARVAAGLRAHRTGEALTTPVGEALLGRVVDPLGTPRDARPAPRARERRPLERPATPIRDRAPVDAPLHTGVKAVDALVPIGRGQRELILGDRQTGKTSLALAAVLAQRGRDVPCVWCSVGRRGPANASLVATLRRTGALAHTTVVVAAADDPPGLRVRAPFAAMSIAEAWMEQGQDALLVIDDVTQHARSHREVALLLRRPPGREAYPGDVFHLHARLLERATRRRAEAGGGSVTALPILETVEQDLASYVPTNLISITDGQVLLDADLAARGAMPAIDVGRSVSRVGGRAQSPALRSVAERLRLDVAQFEELERFARFGADLDADTEATLRRGRRVRAVLTQDALETVDEGEQWATTFAAAEGLLDDVEAAALDAAQAAIREAMRTRHEALAERIRSGAALREDDREAARTWIATVVDEVRAAQGGDGSAS